MAELEARYYRLGEMAAEAPMPGIMRRRIIGEKAMVSDVRIAKGCEVPWHQHPNEQIALVLEGRLQFDVATPDGGTRRYILEAGDALHLPGHVGHGGMALEDCRAIDIFSPPTEATGIDQSATKG
jgi:quercetin dioxygenase-like cupin family protein